MPPEPLPPDPLLLDPEPELDDPLPEPEELEPDPLDPPDDEAVPDPGDCHGSGVVDVPLHAATAPKRTKHPLRATSLADGLRIRFLPSQRLRVT